MSLIWMDGFENSSLWSRKYLLAGSTAPSSTTGRSGNGVLFTGHTSVPGYIRYTLASADQHATITNGFAYRVETASGFPTSTGDPILGLWGDGGTVLHSALIASSTSGGNLIATRSNTTLGTSSGVTLATGIWYYIEVTFTLHDTTGAVTVKVNETTVLSLTNVDTKNAGSGSVYDMIHIGARSTSSQNATYDDWYVTNGAGSAYTGMVGDVTVETVRPNGNGNSSQWVGSDSNSTDNYLLVDEDTYDSADYVQSSTANEKDLYTYGDLAAASGGVKGVMVLGTMQKTASGAKSARQITRVGGTNYNGASVTLDTSDLARKQTWEVSPATAVDWTISEVNGAEFGVEVL